MSPAARPTLSVVVPIYNVAGYLAECLESILTQPVEGAEIVAVDDGSTDDSSAILAEFAARDPRVRVVTQANRGLGAARNAGVDHATGSFLWFVDSDDRLVPGAMAMMLGTITSTGSDLVAGNALRLIGDDVQPTRFLAETFARTRLRTHIRRFPSLINDRVAWNKVYRRSFWDRHSFRFPEGVHYEDLGVTLPAHYLANRVDVRHEPVYLWRVREDQAGTSITQQRTDPQSMQDRVTAVASVSRFLAHHGRRRDKLRYDESAVTHDLRYFLDVFDLADEHYREAFLAASNEFLATIDERAFARLPAIRRLQWELVRRRDADRVAELVRFERQDLAHARATHSGRVWYADFPGRDDPDLSDEQFVVRRELRLISTITSVKVDDAFVRVNGHAAIDLVGDVTRRLRLIAVPHGVGRPLAFHVTVSDSGEYLAELSLARLRATDGQDLEWRLILIARDHGLRRVAAWHESGAASLSAGNISARNVSAGRIVQLGGRPADVRLALTGRGRLTVTTSRHPVRVQQVWLDGDILEIAGGTSRPLAATELVVSGVAAIDRLPFHVEPSGVGSTFVARLPLRPLAAGGGNWEIRIVSGGEHRGLAYLGDPLTALVDGRELRVQANAGGYLSVSDG
jgi:glycosyltransferase involved in cell wall biosynthesis